MSDAPNQNLRNALHYVSNLVIVGLIQLAKLLPYATRVRLMGAVVERVIGPIAGYRKRALTNLARIRPDLPLAQREQIARGCLNNFGRTFIENYSVADFEKQLAGLPAQGPGFAAIQDAAAKGQPVVLVTGHFGNYEAGRLALVAQGLTIGALYRDMKNPYFNAHYVKTITDRGGPGFSQDRKGVAGFVRHLKQGGQLVMLIDLHVQGAPILDFMGEPARTSVSPAELAMRYDALLVPYYGIRQADGLNFDAVFEAPVPHSDPLTMTQALNDSLSARAQANPEQWFWVHRRWRSHEP